jgi:hypothetical protein
MESIPRHLLLAALLTAAPPLVSVGPPPPVGFGEAGAQWRDAPEYVTLFAPVNRRSLYAAAVSPASLESVLAGIEQDAAALLVPGAWQVRDESAPDAFGTAGLYNEWQLKRLYGGRLVGVARGARMDRGRVTESWTLISPYPSTDLRTLQPGTLRLVLTIAP